MSQCTVPVVTDIVRIMIIIVNIIVVLCYSYYCGNVKLATVVIIMIVLHCCYYCGNDKLVVMVVMTVITLH